MPTKLAEIADSNAALLDNQPSDTQVAEATDTEKVGTEATDETSPVGHESATLDVNTVLAGLKARVDSGELKLEDIPQELLPADARKVQSSFARKFAPIQRGTDRAAEALAEAGVSLPEGKTVMDLITENGGKGFADLIKQSVNGALAPLKREIDVNELNKNIRGALDVTVKDSPDLQPLLPQIGKVIEANEQLSQWASNIDAIPYIIKGVGRDIQFQEATRVAGALKAENTRLKDILKKANIAITNGSETSKAGSGKAPTGANDNEPKAKGLDKIASALFDQIAAQARAN